MKEFLIDMHNKNCPSNPKNKREYNDDLADQLAFQYSFFCENNPERFLFFLKDNFYLITYHSCIKNHFGFYDNYDFKVALLKQAIKDNKMFERCNIEKSRHFSEDLKEYRLRNIKLKKFITQINYFYSGFSKTYAITTEIDYFESLLNTETLEANYKSAKESLKNTNKEYLLNELEELYYANTNFDYEPYLQLECIKTVDHLINEINKLTKT